VNLVEPDESLNRTRNHWRGDGVHRVLGPGLLESVYANAMCVELQARKIPFTRQTIVRFRYKDVEIGEGRVDFLIADRIILELKSIEAILDVHVAQLLTYLRTTGHKLGLLTNFNVPRLKDGIRRIIAS